MSAIDMYNRRKGYEQRRLSAADERFRLADMMGRVSDAGVQTDDGLDEALLKEIQMEVAGEGGDGSEDGGDHVEEEEEEEDVAAAKEFDAAADEAFAYAAAAFADIRCDGRLLSTASLPLTSPCRSQLDVAFFSEADVAAAAAAATDTLQHLHLQPAEGAEDWAGISDDDDASSLPAPPPPPAAALHGVSEAAAASSSSSDEECQRLVRLINAAGAGDDRAMDELIEALEVRRVTCDV